ncbi:MAG TPA: heme ABC transporter substrate-binding protein IsdE [Lachnospiraceae bacterium]|nr:heme ABC transporter substrate-binding protein IsdE [Lachnospiraceae bacterium]
MTRIRSHVCLVIGCVLSLVLRGCVDQHPENGEEQKSRVVSSEETFTGSESAESSASDSLPAMLEITDEAEKAAVEAAREKVKGLGREPRLIATSPAVADICDKLDLDLAGVCETSVSALPSRYEGITTVGAAMSPDMEIISSLAPDWILSPASLQSDLQPKYETVKTEWAFLNLKSVQGMYRSIQELGSIFDRGAEAEQLVSDFISFYDKYQKENAEKQHPKVLILMGLPGSYIIATPNSYVGNLVELAGGDNVYSDTEEEFLTVNTEDMKKKEPDVILRAAHALPDQVAEMFADEFATSDIWKHFTAVQEGRVYDLSYDKFGMSAAFSYKEALDELRPMLYP